MKRRQQKKYIVLQKGDRVRLHKYRDKIKRRKRRRKRNQKGGVYFADKMLRSALNCFEKK